MKQPGSKTKQNCDLDALVAFNLVASHGGFGAASRASTKPKATLSRSIRRLEHDLEIRLIDRDSRTFRLTDEGTHLWSQTEGLLSKLQEVISDLLIDSTRPSGKLRVSSSMVFGQLAMGKIAAEFIQRFPNVVMEATVDDRQVDLIAEGYDVVIRVNPSEKSQLVGRCFHRDELVLVAPAGMERPEHAEMPIKAVAGSDAPDLEHWVAITEGIEKGYTLKTAVRLASPLMVRDAVLAGAGVAVLPRLLVSKNLRDGKIKEWGQIPDKKVEIWALHASRRLTSARVSAFMDFIAEFGAQLIAHPE